MMTIKLSESKKDIIEQLKKWLDYLIKNIVITEDKNLRDIQQLQREIIREDLAVLLVYISNTNFLAKYNEKNPLLLWSLVEPHLPSEIRLNLTQVERYKNLFSQPLVGQPSDVLNRTGLCKPGSLLATIVKQLRDKMIPSQHKLLLKIIGRII